MWVRGARWDFEVLISLSSVDRSHPIGQHGGVMAVSRWRNNVEETWRIAVAASLPSRDAHSTGSRAKSGMEKGRGGSRGSLKGSSGSREGCGPVLPRSL